MLAPAQLYAVQHIGGDAINASLVELILQDVVQSPPLARRVGRETFGLNARSLQARLKHLWILDIKLASPEAREDIHEKTAKRRSLFRAHP